MIPSEYAEECRIPREETICLLETDKYQEIFRTAAEHIKSRIEDKSFSPLANYSHMDKLMKECTETNQAFTQVLVLGGRDIFKEIPTEKNFTVFAAPYVGPNGKKRQPLPKYVPNHIVPRINKMQRAYLKFLDKHYDSALPKRPGFIVQSGYRSPFYQAGLQIRVIKEKGIGHALKSTMPPGASQHADYDHCAIDFCNLGDEYGKAKRQDGTHIGFERTMEFLWLLENGSDYGFWLPYYPNPSNVLNETGADGVLVEPWHFQFKENAEELMNKNNVIDLFLARLEKAK